MKPKLTILGSIVLTLMLTLVNLYTVASGKKANEIGKDNYVIILDEENENLLPNELDNMEESKITNKKTCYLLKESDYEKQKKIHYNETQNTMQSPNHDFVWHLFIQSIPVMYIINDESLHLLEIL